MTQVSRSTPHSYEVSYIPKGQSEPEVHYLPADEWLADHDTAVEAIIARYEADYGEVLTIHYRPNQPNERFPTGRQLYGNRRFE